MMTKEEIADAFEMDLAVLDDCVIHYAKEESEDYSGEIFVLYSCNGKLYEVQSAHCSCDGFTWDPDETTIESLRSRKASPYSTTPLESHEAADAYEKYLQEELTRI